VDSSYSLGARPGWLTNNSTSLICGEHAVNETRISANSFAVRRETARKVFDVALTFLGHSIGEVAAEN
jgi:hypothetical protein